MKVIASLLIISVIPTACLATIWEVGPSKTYSRPSQVSGLVNDGDTVYIQAGEYKKDVCIWRADRLKLIGLGGKAHLNAEKTAYGGKAIWVIAGDDTYVENIEFSNCEVVDLNGAGIRLEGTNLTVRSCHFHHNQEGILAGDNPNSDVLVEYSEFGYNGAGDGYSHNIYINRLRTLVFQYNYVHHAFYGHEIKSRAYRNIIIYNRITNEDGSASYEIDLPNGGPCLIMGNIIQQSRFSDNNGIVSYAREGMTNPGPHNLYFIHNTVVNNEDRGIALNIQSNTDTVFSANNIFCGPMSILVGIPKDYVNLNNLLRQDVSELQFASAANYDYHLSDTSPGIDSAAILQRIFLEHSLWPDLEYLHPVSWKPRFKDAKPDIGAFELQQITRTENQKKIQEQGVYYDDTHKCLVYRNSGNHSNRVGIKIQIIDGNGRIILVNRLNDQGIISLRELQAGIYYYYLLCENEPLRGSFFIK